MQRLGFPIRHGVVRDHLPERGVVCLHQVGLLMCVEMGLDADLVRHREGLFEQLRFVWVQTLVLLKLLDQAPGAEVRGGGVVVPT